MRSNVELMKCHVSIEPRCLPGATVFHVCCFWALGVMVLVMVREERTKMANTSNNLIATVNQESAVNERNGAEVSVGSCIFLSHLPMSVMRKDSFCSVFILRVSDGRILA